ncbi:hypothetical protein MMC11_003450 [Xylographa trunciseda]|nr:hypothetical protein [Xylographa trunciseda]
MPQDILLPRQPQTFVSKSIKHQLNHSRSDFELRRAVEKSQTRSTSGGLAAYFEPDSQAEVRPTYEKAYTIPVAKMCIQPRYIFNCTRAALKKVGVDDATDDELIDCLMHTQLGDPEQCEAAATERGSGPFYCDKITDDFRDLPTGVRTNGECPLCREEETNLTIPRHQLPPGVRKRYEAQMAKKELGAQVARNIQAWLYNGESKDSEVTE